MKKKFIKTVSAATFIFSLICFCAIGFYSAIYPDNYCVTESGELKIVYRDEIKATRVQSSNKQTASISEENKPGSSYKSRLSLFGVFPIKDVDVSVVKNITVLPGGMPFGIKMHTNGVLVVGLADVDCEGVHRNPAKIAGIKTGDILVEIDDEKLKSNENVAEIIEKSQGRQLKVKVNRNDIEFYVFLTPLFSQSEKVYKGGMWVRDSSSGIGTLTYIDPQSRKFGGLGHAVCDIDTGAIMPLMSGEIVGVEICGVVKSRNGIPGELRGYFTDNSNISGNLTHNGERGVFGDYTGTLFNTKPIPVAMKQQVKSGSAKIYTTINGSKPEYFDINIESVNYNKNNPTKNMIIEITDPRLIELAGGIVQGMSGSPIIQNGMLVGAVTHVFVNDSKKGYGIFAENMLEYSMKGSNSTQDAA